MTFGYEACNVCSWKHVFWEDEGEPQPQLIAGLSSGNPYVCPRCGASGRRMLVGSVPASTFLITGSEIEAHLKTKELS